MKDNQQAALVEAVKQAQGSEFGLTGVKVELEIKFNRHLCPRPNHGCETCDNRGELDCENCDEGIVYCEYCLDGQVNCSECEGGCDDCINGSVDCPECEGEHEWECNDCEGLARRTCYDCSGLSAESTGSTEDAPDWRDLKHVHDRVLAKLVRYGLAAKQTAAEKARGAYSLAYDYKPKSPLVFSKVYHDGTVDTEMTFSLALDNPANVLLLPKIVAAFYSLKDEIGQDVDVSGAGMHIALLNSQGATYPDRSTREDYLRFDNFRKSMILLMPALFFLASANEKSRPMGFRAPRISDQDKYSAIAYRGAALEFRVFETCYEQPAAILDDIMVALNCLRFWKLRYQRNYLSKVSRRVNFGVDSGDKLARLYVTSEHIDLLNRGLKMIKPQWYTISELKAQRNFKVTKNDTKNLEKRARLQAEQEYVEYENHFGWQRVLHRNNFINRYLEEQMAAQSRLESLGPEVLKAAEDYAEARVKDRIDPGKQTLHVYIENALPKLTKAGDWTLCAE
jgi:hypothetical protein